MDRQAWIKARQRAFRHGWREHSSNMRGVWMNLHGDRILYIDKGTGWVQYRGSRNQLAMALIPAERNSPW